MPSTVNNLKQEKENPMNTRQLIITAFSVATFVVGCKPSSQTPPESLNQAEAQAQLDRAKKETKEAAQAVNDYAYSRKSEFVAAMRDEIKELDREIEKYSAKIESSSESTREEAKAKIQKLREKTADLGKKLDQMNDANESTWEEVKKGFRNGYDDTKEAFKDARQWLSDKIAP